MEEAAFVRFYKETYAMLRAYVGRNVRDEMAADDITQDAYVRLLQADTSRLEPEKMKAYLYRIATNLMHDRGRRKRRHDDYEASVNGEGAVNAAAAPDLGIDLEDAFDRLPEKQRTLLWLAYVEGYGHRDIAAIMNLREKNVRVVLFHARRKIAAVLRRGGFERGSKE